jgi:hypothetical protein
MASNDKYINWEAAVALGKTTGNEAWNIFGYNTGAGTNLRAMWYRANTTDYVFPSAAQIMQVKSTDAADTMNLLIQGLDANYDRISETVTLAGTSVVSTTKEYLRLNGAIILAGSNAGTIDIGDDLAGTPTYYKGIRPGDGRCQDSFSTIPRGYQFALYRIDAFSADGTAAKPAVFRNYVANESGRILNVARTTFFNNMNIQRRIPFVYAEKTDIQFQLSSITGSHEMGVFGEGVLHEMDNQEHLNNLDA